MAKKSETAQQSNKTVNVHAGHRQRMLEKLNRAELCEHELLEVLLFFAIPRQNTNEIAHRLLLEFGTIKNVFSARAEELERVDGIGKNSAGFLQCIGEIYKQMETVAKNTFPQTYEEQIFRAFIKKEYQREQEEVLDAYLLDGNGNIFMRRRYKDFSDVNVRFPIQWLQAVLMENTPSGLILVHNHPSGNSNPSTLDDVATEKCQELCFSSGVLFCEHCIYAKDGIFSYYDSGRLKKIAVACMRRNSRTYLETGDLEEQ